MSLPAVRFYNYHPSVASLRDEVINGLSATPKAIPPKFFYDERGSQLFDAICELPEYYLTRTEVGIMREHALEIARLAGPETLLIELGSGASKKVRLLLEALRPSAYLGVDISKDCLLTSTRRLAADYPWLEVHVACADFAQVLNKPPVGSRCIWSAGGRSGYRSRSEPSALYPEKPSTPRTPTSTRRRSCRDWPSRQVSGRCAYGRTRKTHSASIISASDPRGSASRTHGTPW